VITKIENNSLLPEKTLSFSLNEVDNEKLNSFENKNPSIKQPFKIRFPLSEVYSSSNEERQIIAARTWITNKNAILNKINEKQAKRKEETLSEHIVGDHTTEYNGNLIYIKKNIKLKQFEFFNVLYNK